MAHQLGWGGVAITVGSQEKAFVGTSFNVGCVASSIWTSHFFIQPSEFQSGAVFDGLHNTLSVGDYIVVEYGQTKYCIKIQEIITNTTFHGGASANNGLGITTVPFSHTSTGGHGPFTQGQQVAYEQLPLGSFSGATPQVTVYPDCSSCMGGVVAPSYHLMEWCDEPGNVYIPVVNNTGSSVPDVTENTAWLADQGWPSQPPRYFAMGSQDPNGRCYKYLGYGSSSGTIGGLNFVTNWPWTQHYSCGINTINYTNYCGNPPEEKFHLIRYCGADSDLYIPVMNANGSPFVDAAENAAWFATQNPQIGEIFDIGWGMCYEYMGEGPESTATGGGVNHATQYMPHPQFDDCVNCSGGEKPCNPSDWEPITHPYPALTMESAPGANDGIITIPLSQYSIWEQPVCMPELLIESNPAGNFSQTVSLVYVNSLFSSISLGGLSPGNYTYTLNFVDGTAATCSAGECGVNGIFTIDPATPEDCRVTISASTPEQKCSGSVELKIDIDSPASDYQVDWKDSSGVTLETDTGTACTGCTETYNTATQDDISVVVTLVGSQLNNCTFTNPVFTHTFTGIQQSAITATITGTDETIAGANDGTAMVIATGGSGALTYAWSHGPNQAIVSNLSPGGYSCVVSDSTKECDVIVYITINAGIEYPSPDSLDVCLNLDTGTFEFTDNNIYIPVGFTPCILAITIKHSNGTVAYPGSLLSPDIFTDSDLPGTRTYDEPSKLGKNFSIPIPMSSGNNYIDDVYEIIIDWNFSSGVSIDYSKTVYLNASDIDLFGDITIDAILQHDCLGDIESIDNTDYNVSSIPFTFTRTHELFPPASSGLSSPVVSTGMSYISYDLYEGDWSNMITTSIVWDIPSAPSPTVVYIGACVIRTIIGSSVDNVACNIDSCGINEHLKKLKNRYDNAVCVRDIVNINKYRDKYQRAIELFTLYVLGEGAGCADDYSELWDILEITNLDDITDLSCCGDPRVNMNMAEVMIVL